MEEALRDAVSLCRLQRVECPLMRRCMSKLPDTRLLVSTVADTTLDTSASKLENSLESILEKA